MTDNTLLLHVCFLLSVYKFTSEANSFSRHTIFIVCVKYRNKWSFI